MSYGKIHDAYWTDDKIQPLSDAAKLLGCYFLSSPHRNAIGCARVPAQYIAADLAWDVGKVEQAIGELERISFITRDRATGWTLINNLMRYDPISGGKAALGALKVARTVPRHLGVYRELHKRLAPIIERELKDHPDPSSRTIEAPSMPLADTPSIPLPNAHPIPLPTPIEAQPISVSGTLSVSGAAAAPPDAPSEPAAAAPAGEHVQRIAIGERVLEAAGIDPSKWLGTFALVSAWLSATYDPELDILPAVRAVAKRPGYKPPRSLGYFTEAIEQHWRDRCLDIPKTLARPQPTAPVGSPEWKFGRAIERWGMNGADPASKPKPEDFGVAS